MSRSSTAAILLFLALLAGAVGLVDSAREGAGDHLVLFAAVVVLGSALGFWTFVGNPTVTIRHDILRWATRRSQLTGERVDQIVGRAVDGYRALLEPADGEPASSDVRRGAAVPGGASEGDRDGG